MAQAYFVEGKYKEAQKKLILIEKKKLYLKYNIYHKLNYHKLFFQTYFESKHDPSFDHERASFKKWIGDQTKFSNTTKQVYLNFLNIITKIYYAASLAEQQKLIKEVLSSDMPITVFDRIWLEKKLKGKEKTPPPCNKFRSKIN